MLLKKCCEQGSNAGLGQSKPRPAAYLKQRPSPAQRDARIGTRGRSNPRRSLIRGPLTRRGRVEVKRVPLQPGVGRLRQTAIKRRTWRAGELRSRGLEARGDLRRYWINRVSRRVPGISGALGSLAARRERGKRPRYLFSCPGRNNASPRIQPRSGAECSTSTVGGGAKSGWRGSWGGNVGRGSVTDATTPHVGAFSWRRPSTHDMVRDNGGDELVE